MSVAKCLAPGRSWPAAAGPCIRHRSVANPFQHKWRPVRPDRRFARAVGRAALVLLVASGGCAPLLGDVELEKIVEPAYGTSEMTGQGTGAVASGEDVGPLASLGGASSSGFEGECAVGSVRCSGAALQLCDGSRWISTNICASAALCKTDPPACEAAACALDELSCAGAALQICNAERDGWDLLDTCAAPAYCNPNARQCMATPCAEGELSCNSEQLQRCADLLQGP